MSECEYCGEDAGGLPVHLECALAWLGRERMRAEEACNKCGEPISLIVQGENYAGTPYYSCKCSTYVARREDQERGQWSEIESRYGILEAGTIE